MKQFEDKVKKEKLADIMQNRKQVSFKVLEQLEEEGMLDDYDLFRAISDHFSDMYMFYYKGQYFIINQRQDDFREVNRELLEGRYFLLNKCITNNAQGFIQRYGTEAFDKLSIKELIEVMLAHRDSLLSIEEER